MTDYEKIRLYRNAFNTYPTENGILTTEIREGYAKACLTVEPRHLNAIRSVHGGLIFTLADTVAGSAASSRGSMMTTMDCTMHYLRAAIDVKYLYGTATEIKHGKTASLYQVEITDEKGTLIARGEFTYFDLKRELIPEGWTP